MECLALLMSKVGGREILLHDLGMSLRRENLFEDILYIIMSVARDHNSLPPLHLMHPNPISNVQYSQIM
jgi:hypothetical protein